MHPEVLVYLLHFALRIINYVFTFVAILSTCLYVHCIAVMFTLCGGNKLANNAMQWNLMLQSQLSAAKVNCTFLGLTFHCKITALAFSYLRDIS